MYVNRIYVAMCILTEEEYVSVSRGGQYKNQRRIGDLGNATRIGGDASRR